MRAMYSGRSRDYVGEVEDPKHWASEYTACPRCGGEMRSTSEMCQACWDEEHAERHTREMIPGMLERHHLYEAALATGLWTVEELQILADKGRIPTKRDIVMRVWERVGG